MTFELRKSDIADYEVRWAGTVLLGYIDDYSSPDNPEWHIAPEKNRG